MKKIVPFNNVLQFNTDVKEITAISLEHEIKKYPDMISGVFYVSGEYKITDGQLEKEKFNFELPFDIALSNNYNLDTLLIDIDDFRYDIISDKNLKINIDLYIDGEEIEPPLPREIPKEELPDININSLEKEILSSISNNEESKRVNQNENFVSEEVSKSYSETEIPQEEDEELIPLEDTLKSPKEEIEVIGEPERIDLLKDMLTTNKEDTMDKELNLNINNNNENENKNINNNIFSPDGEEEYVTYRVYKVVEGDTIDSILTKYNITKEMLSDYNSIENITPGDKLIIPTNEK